MASKIGKVAAWLSQGNPVDDHEDFWRWLIVMTVIVVTAVSGVWFDNKRLYDIGFGGILGFYARRWTVCK